MDYSIFGIVASALAGVGSLYAIRVSRHKIAAEVDSVIVTSAEKAVELGIKQLNYLENENARLQMMLEKERRLNETMEALLVEVKALRLEVKKLKDEVATLRVEMAKRPTKEELTIQVSDLIRQLADLGVKPE